MSATRTKCVLAVLLAATLSSAGVLAGAQESAKDKEKQKAADSDEYRQKDQMKKAGDKQPERAMLQTGSTAMGEGRAVLDPNQDLTSPGEHHEHLAAMVGNWKATVKFWPEPGADPIPMTGTAKNEMILGGRFLKSEYSGEMLGQPFAGLGIDGYDNQKSRHISQWMDTTGTMVSLYRGECSEGGKVLTAFTTMMDPATGRVRQVRGVTTLVDQNTYTYESADVVGDQTLKTMEIVFTRQ